MHFFRVAIIQRCWLSNADFYFQWLFGLFLAFLSSHPITSRSGRIPGKISPWIILPWNWWICQNSRPKCHIRIPRSAGLLFASMAWRRGRQPLIHRVFHQLGRTRKKFAYKEAKARQRGQSRWSGPLFATGGSLFGTKCKTCLPLLYEGIIINSTSFPLGLFLLIQYTQASISFNFFTDLPITEH